MADSHSELATIWAAWFWDKATESDLEAANLLALAFERCSGALGLLERSPRRPLRSGAVDGALDGSFLRLLEAIFAGELGAYLCLKTPGLVGGLARGAELIE